MSARVHTPGLAGCDVDAKKTAVLFIEYQNEFTSEGGKMHDAVKVSWTRNYFLLILATLLERFNVSTFKSTSFLPSSPPGRHDRDRDDGQLCGGG